MNRWFWGALIGSFTVVVLSSQPKPKPRIKAGNVRIHHYADGSIIEEHDDGTRIERYRPPPRQ